MQRHVLDYEATTSVGRVYDQRRQCDCIDFGEARFKPISLDNIGHSKYRYTAISRCFLK